MFLDPRAQVKCSEDAHLHAHKTVEESSFENWARSGLVLEFDGDVKAEDEDDVDFLDLVFELLEKGNARDKGSNWKSAGEVEEHREDAGDQDGETGLNYDGD